MRKSTTAPWFIGAWIVAVVAGAVAGVIRRGASGGSPSSTLTILGLLIGLCAIGMLIMWIGALVRLGHLRRWGWFAFVLLVYLLSVGALGIVVMVAYALFGPDDMVVRVTRPSVT